MDKNVPQVAARDVFVASDDPIERPGRRMFLTRSAALTAGVVATGASAAVAAADSGGAAALPVWSRAPGSPLRAYGMPSKFEEPVKRVVTSGYPTISPGTGSSLTPLQALEGTITPAGLHFERHHSGVPDIDPKEHRLVIHGLVRRPVSLLGRSRYRAIRWSARTHFVECAGNSRATPDRSRCSSRAARSTASCRTANGRVFRFRSCSRKPASILPRSGCYAEGADAAAISRSVPLDKELDDAMIALYQNGERCGPSTAIPMRLLLPGWEGNMNVKWLRQLKLTAEPHAHARTKPRSTRISCATASRSSSRSRSA